ncbi:MAG TPA: type II secretion system protein [Candidatus Paceibacterota bacterium]
MPLLNAKRYSLNASSGFTLIELLVVISIIGLLSSIVFASLGNARKNARIVSAHGSMRNMLTGVLLCIDGGGAVAGPTATQDGGGGNVCSDTTLTTQKYGALPPGWTFTAVGAYPTNPLKATGDGATVTCTDSGCVKS